MAVRLSPRRPACSGPCAPGLSAWPCPGALLSSGRRSLTSLPCHHYQLVSRCQGQVVTVCQTTRLALTSQSIHPDCPSGTRQTDFVIITDLSLTYRTVAIRPGRQARPRPDSHQQHQDLSSPDSPGRRQDALSGAAAGPGQACPSSLARQASSGFHWTPVINKSTGQACQHQTTTNRPTTNNKYNYAQVNQTLS